MIVVLLDNPAEIDHVTFPNTLIAGIGLLSGRMSYFVDEGDKLFLSRFVALYQLRANRTKDGVLMVSITEDGTVILIQNIL